MTSINQHKLRSVQSLFRNTVQSMQLFQSSLAAATASHVVTNLLQDKQVRATGDCASQYHIGGTHRLFDIT